MVQGVNLKTNFKIFSLHHSKVILILFSVSNSQIASVYTAAGVQMPSGSAPGSPAKKKDQQQKNGKANGASKANNQNNKNKKQAEEDSKPKKPKTLKEAVKKVRQNHRFLLNFSKIKY